MHRSTLLTGLIFAAALVGSGAQAANNVSFTPAAFAAAQKSGQAMLVEIHAPWCPTCRAQEPILAKLERQPKFKNLIVMRVDFDSQKSALRSLGAQSQSTLITFKNGQETARSVGVTDPTALAELLDQAH